MRLMEFIYSLCDGEDDFSEDTFDKDLKRYKRKRGKPIREIFAEKDTLYEAEKKKKDEYIDGLLADYDRDLANSNTSNKSLIGSVIHSNKSCDNDDVEQDCLSLSSMSSDSRSVLVNSPPKRNDVVTAITGNNISVPVQHNIINLGTFTSDQIYIPDGFSTIYYSSETDKVKVKELNKFDAYLTDNLREEMSKLYPKSKDITHDTLTNDIIMDKNQFSTNFSKMFHKGRIFLNYLQLREAVKEFFKHWNVLSKSNGKT